MRRAVALALLLVACGPKGSNKPATIEKTSTGDFVIRHPNFQGRLDPKFVREGQAFRMKLAYSGFPQKSAIVFAGKTIPLPHAGADVETNIDLSAPTGDAPIGALTGGTAVPVNLPFELTFFGGRQKVASAINGVSASQELRSCFQYAPCVFPTDGPPNAKPNIVYLARADHWQSKVIGNPARVRDIDWVAVGVATEPIEEKKCKMQRTVGGVPLDEELTLVRETEKVTIYDRRTGATLHTKDFAASDVCPGYANVKLTGPKSGLRNELQPSQHERWFDELRGDAPRPPASAAPSAAPKPKGKR